jgi:nucleoid-associated protein YejK
MLNPFCCHASPGFLFMKKLAFASLTLVLLSACASIAVNEDSLVKRTSFALSLAPEDFAISNRSDEGVRTDYQVQTKAGRRYSCYVTGTMSVMGRTVSDAICNEVSRPAAVAPSQPEAAPKPACNALLKAAKKC